MNYIFDTNILRNIAHDDDYDRFNRGKHGNILFPIVVALELVCHCKLNDKAFKDCKKSLGILVENMVKVNAGQFNLDNCLPDMPTILFCYFNEQMEIKKIKEIESLVSLSCDIVNGQVENNDRTIDSFIGYRNLIIDQFINNIDEFYLPRLFGRCNVKWNEIFKDRIKRRDFEDKLNNGFFNKLLSKALIYEFGQKCNSFNNMCLVNKVCDDFSVSIDFFVQNILRQFVASSEAALKLSDINIDRNGHNPKWNSYFDMQLILGIEYYNCILKKDTIFVTAEKKIHDAFIKNGNEDLVL